MKRLGRIIENIANIGGYFSGWLVPLMMLLVLYEVFMRYVLNQPPMIADEFSAYMLVALTFLGAAYTWIEKGHVRITALISRLPQRIASKIGLVRLALVLIFSVLVAQASVGYVNHSFKVHMSSATIYRTPLQVPQMTIAIGFILLCLVVLIELVRAIRNIRSSRTASEESR